jgi:hypothetical protein
MCAGGDKGTILPRDTIREIAACEVIPHRLESAVNLVLLAIQDESGPGPIARDYAIDQAVRLASILRERLHSTVTELDTDDIDVLVDDVDDGEDGST